MGHDNLWFGWTLHGTIHVSLQLQLTRFWIGSCLPPSFCFFFCSVVIQHLPAFERRDTSHHIVEWLTFISTLRYFKTKDGLYGLSCFERIAVDNVAERGARMKSVGIICAKYTSLHEHMQFLEEEVRWVLIVNLPICHWWGSNHDQYAIYWVIHILAVCGAFLT